MGTGRKLNAEVHKEGTKLSDAATDKAKCGREKEQMWGKWSLENKR